MGADTNAPLPKTVARIRAHKPLVKRGMMWSPEHFGGTCTMCAIAA